MDHALFLQFVLVHQDRVLVLLLWLLFVLQEQPFHLALALQILCLHLAFDTYHQFQELGNFFQMSLQFFYQSQLEPLNQIYYFLLPLLLFLMLVLAAYALLQHQKILAFLKIVAEKKIVIFCMHQSVV